MSGTKPGRCRADGLRSVRGVPGGYPDSWDDPDDSAELRARAEVAEQGLISGQGHSLWCGRTKHRPNDVAELGRFRGSRAAPCSRGDVRCRTCCSRCQAADLLAGKCDPCGKMT